MNILCWLMNWYQLNCDGDWEHLYGIKIDTIDNPGWSVDIDLIDTPLENKVFKKIKINSSNDNWIICRVENNIYKGDGDPSKLEKILTIFKKWVES